MINWVELNKDGLLASLIIALFMLPIGELFTTIIHKKRDRKKVYRHTNKSGNAKNTKHPKEPITLKTNNEESHTVEVRTIYVEKTSKSSDDSDSAIFVIILLILIAATSFFYKYEDIIANIIYIISCLGFWINVTMLAKEIKRTGEKKVIFLMTWTCCLWIYILISMHLLYHPMYVSKGAVVAKQAIKNGQGILSGGFEGLAYLLYQFLGILFLAILILFVIAVQIYSLVVWWDESRNISDNSKFFTKIFRFLDRLFYPNYKFIITSTVIIIMSFLFEGGMLIHLIFNNHIQS